MTEGQKDATGHKKENSLLQEKWVAVGFGVSYPIIGTEADAIQVAKEKGIPRDDVRRLKNS
jgi:hypothetical protein